MARIEDYALLGDTHSAALVSIDGSIDWLCVPRFDSASCFGALLDEQKGGRWQIAPAGAPDRARRTYRPDSMVLETTFEKGDGKVLLIDCLPLQRPSNPLSPRQVFPEEIVARVVKGVSGTVRMEMEYAPRFDYGDVVPWLRPVNGVISAVGGPDALDLRAEVPLEIDGATVRASFDVSEGETCAFITSYRQSHLEPNLGRLPAQCEELIRETDRFWREWASQCELEGRWKDEIVRSLLVLKALTYSPTGGIAAAATTSLPEAIGGVRNWDYRYCWLRDATFTLEVLLAHGYTAEAEEWRDWLLRAVAGDPQDIQIMYGVRGERRLPELELGWLSGYEGSRPVRVGNAAVEQFQLDVYGEVMDALHSARRAGIDTSAEDWELERWIADFVCRVWREPDEGIWEVRSGRKHFVHSKVMAWVAIDRAISAVENFGKSGPVERWKKVRAEIREEVLTKGFHSERGHFVRAYGDTELDASLLMLPLVGFIEATDERMRATIEAIEAELVVDGYVLRYRTEATDDGLPPGEGAFLMCTFWLVDCLVLLERYDDAEDLFRLLVAKLNDVGLLSEQYDPRLGRLVGNFPQAFSHVALATAALALQRAGESPGVRRGMRVPPAARGKPEAGRALRGSFSC